MTTVLSENNVKLVDRVNNFDLATSNVAFSWFKVDLLNCYLQINYYSIRARSRYAQINKNWKIQGSNDTVNWTDLDSQVDNLLTNNQWFSKAIQNQVSAYRYFRILQNGLNSTNDNVLTLGELELYGTLCSKI